MIDPELKQYLETDFTFMLIVGMSKVFITREELNAELDKLRIEIQAMAEKL